MATPAELSKAVSRATGLPYATVVDFDRRLTLGGLRTKGGRGFNAAKMTPLDAARLLTAILGSPLTNKAVETVRRYTKAVVDPQRSSATLFAKSGIDELTALPEHHSLVNALAALISAAASGSLTKREIELFAFTRVTYGRIRLSDLPGGTTVEVEYRPTSRIQKAKSPTEGDLEQSRRLTARTILAVAKLFEEETRHGER